MTDPQVCLTCGFWDGERRLLSGGVELERAAGHFPGDTVLHLPAGADGRGVLLTGNIVMVMPDQRPVAHRYSYPYLILLPVREVERIGVALEPLALDAILGGLRGRVVAADGKEVVRRSVGRYPKAVQGGQNGT